MSIERYPNSVRMNSHASFLAISEVIDIFESIRREFPTENGKNADYIPELAIVDTELFGLSLVRKKERIYFKVTYPIEIH